MTQRGMARHRARSLWRRLPGEDGYGLLRRLRLLHGRDLPAVALTAYAGVADRERALAAGFQQHVVKPVDPQRLVEMVAATLRR